MEEHNAQVRAALNGCILRIRDSRRSAWSCVNIENSRVMFSLGQGFFSAPSATHSGEFKSWTCLREELPAG